MIQKNETTSSQTDGPRTIARGAGTRPVVRDMPPALKELINMMVEALARRWIEQRDHDGSQRPP